MSRVLQGLVDDALIVNCTNEGCSIKASLDAMTRHDRKCPFKEIVHSGGCGTRMLRRDFAEHLRVCMFTIVSCDLCDENLPRGEIQDHLEKSCLKVACICICGLKMERGQMKIHAKEDCPDAIVSCDLGCGSAIRRSDMDKHISENLMKHLRCQAGALRHTREQLRQAKAELRAVKNRLRNVGECVEWSVYSVRRKMSIAEGEPWNKVDLTSPLLQSRSGYCVKVIAYLNGSKESNRGFLSVYVAFAAGPHDSDLSWPFEGKVTITCTAPSGSAHAAGAAAGTASGDEEQVLFLHFLSIRWVIIIHHFIISLVPAFWATISLYSTLDYT